MRCAKANIYCQCLMGVSDPANAPHDLDAAEYQKLLDAGGASLYSLLEDIEGGKATCIAAALGDEPEIIVGPATKRRAPLPLEDAPPLEDPQERALQVFMSSMDEGGLDHVEVIIALPSLPLGPPPWVFW